MVANKDISQKVKLHKNAAQVSKKKIHKLRYLFLGEGNIHKVRKVFTRPLFHFIKIATCKVWAKSLVWTRNWWGMLSKKLTQSWSFIEIWFKFVEWIENYILDYFVRKFNVHIIKSNSENISRFKKYPTNSHFFLYTKENREKFYAVPYLNKCHTYKTSTIF